MTNQTETYTAHLERRIATLEKAWDADEAKQHIAMLAEVLRKCGEHPPSCPSHAAEPRINTACTCGLSEALRTTAGEANEWRRVYAERDEARAEVALLRSHPTPDIGAALPCLLCSRTLPWGVFDGKTGAVVCKECRDAAYAAREAVCLCGGATKAVCAACGGRKPQFDPATSVIGIP